ncbi:MAG: hypothetical protein AAFW95_08130 [Cyanobacteria bacterium J06638_6]
MYPPDTRWVQRLTTHTYNEKTAIAVEASIRNDYFPLLADLYQTLKARLND